MWKHKLIDFVVQFMEEIDSEISAMKIQVNERARTVGHQYLKASLRRLPAWLATRPRPHARLAGVHRVIGAVGALCGEWMVFPGHGRNFGRTSWSSRRRSKICRCRE